MTPERWRQIHDVFAHAVLCPAGERQHFLDRVRGEDAALADEVANLLGHDAQARSEGFLDATCLLNVKAGLADADGAGRLIGRRLGPYEVQQHLASGGMGDVYRAARVADYRQTVAVKVIKDGLGNAELRKRFQIERQVLAGLNHPNIVRLLDGGTTEDGLPYFVMELIDGQPLGRYRTQRQPALRECLCLLVTVAHAVQYAHEQGIIHRDLKPGNVLVTPEGTPKISDFGLAKRLDGLAELAGAESQTQTGVILGTPNYLAPEQAGGSSEAIGPATDVYALGTILYELLTGRPPFQGGTFLNTLEQVRSEEPIAPRRFTPKLPRDVETVCLKALAKNPAGRYATAAAFAADLERFLLGLPVLVRPVSLPVKAARWCRRRPIVAGLLAALVLVTAVGFASVTWQWRRAEAYLAESERQRLQAEQNFHQAHQVVADLFSLSTHDSLRGNPGLNPLQHLIAEEALTYYQVLLRQRGDDPKLLAEAAVASLHVANVYQNDPKLRHQAPAAYELALALSWDLFRKHPNAPAFRSKLADALLHTGSSQQQRGQIAEARRSLEQTIAVLDPYRPDDNDAVFTLAQCYHVLGLVHHDGGRPAHALPWHQKSRAVSEKLIGGSPSSAPFRCLLARNLFHIARCQDKMGRPAEARRAFEESAALWRRLAEEMPLQTSYRRDLAACYHGIGNVHCDGGARTLAAQYFRQALQIRQKLCRDNPNHLPFLRDAAGTEHRLGETLEQLGRTEEALAAYRHALTQQRELVAKAPQEAAYQPRLGELESAVERLSLSSKRAASASGQGR